METDLSAHSVSRELAGDRKGTLMRPMQREDGGRIVDGARLIPRAEVRRGSWMMESRGKLDGGWTRTDF